MNYSTVADVYNEMENTSKRLELTAILSKLFTSTSNDIIDKVVYLTQGKLYPDFVDIEIGFADKLVIKALSIISGLVPAEINRIYNKFGDIGSAAEEILKSKSQTSLFFEELSVRTVFDTLDKIAKSSGKGSVDLRIKLLNSLLNNASPMEAKYVVRTAVGNLRLGIADYTVLDALALAYTGDKKNREHLERAYNLSSDLGLVAKSVALKGLRGLEEFKVKVGNPIRPMLAERLNSTSEIIEKLGGKCASEYKLDGERVQIHYSQDKIKLFSRRLEDITANYPDIEDLCKKKLNCKESILEGEIVAINAKSGKYLPFQELMHRRRIYGVKEAVKDYPISINLFDALYIDGVDLIDSPYVERNSKLVNLVSSSKRIRVVPSKITSTSEEIDSFLQKAISEGCEGLVVKALRGTYRAGAREFSWIKLKRDYEGEFGDSFDLVVVGAFHGHGKRTGKYGAFLLAAYDKAEDLYKTVCKVGTGFSDENLDEFPPLLTPFIINHCHVRVVSKMKADIWFIPTVVMEIMASEITLSPIHTAEMNSVRAGSGLALRFPKFTGRIRSDKSATDCTTTEEFLKMYQGQLKKVRLK
ncbi:MAG TPA: ATP-dependent DNA ligase [Nitrososphaerales archaeon]